MSAALTSRRALVRLLAAYASDVALDLDGAERVVGYVGQDVPEELLTAAGVRALRLRGRPGWNLSRADTYLGTGIDATSRALLAGLLDGRFGDLLGLVVSSDCDASQRLFYVLREIHRVEPRAGLPPVQRASMQQRAAHTKSAVGRCRAELLLGYWREKDEAPGWDFGHQAAAVPVASAEIARQRYGEIDPDALAAALSVRPAREAPIG